MTDRNYLRPRRLEHSEEFTPTFRPSYTSCPYPEVRLVPALAPFHGEETSRMNIQVIRVSRFNFSSLNLSSTVILAGQNNHWHRQSLA